MFGSLNKIWPWKRVVETVVKPSGEVVPVVERNVLPATYTEITGEPSQVLYAVVALVVGLSIIFIIDGVARKIKNNRALSN